MPTWTTPSTPPSTWPRACWRERANKNSAIMKRLQFHHLTHQFIAATTLLMAACSTTPKAIIETFPPTNASTYLSFQPLTEKGLYVTTGEPTVPVTELGSLNIIYTPGGTISHFGRYLYRAKPDTTRQRIPIPSTSIYYTPSSPTKFKAHRPNLPAEKIDSIWQPAKGILSTPVIVYSSIAPNTLMPALADKIIDKGGNGVIRLHTQFIPSSNATSPSHYIITGIVVKLRKDTATTTPTDKI